MEKYGVCNNCRVKPLDPSDLDSFEKLANGNYKCPDCGQLVMAVLGLSDHISMRDTPTQQPQENTEGEDET